MSEGALVSRRGRPRNPDIDERVIAATLELLAEDGFAATTIQSAARRSGVHPSAIYRRWPSRIELIEEAVFPGLDAVAVRPTGDLETDLTRFIGAYLAAWQAPAARAGIPGLLASYQAGASPRPPDAWIRISARPHFYDLLRAAAPGTVDPDVDPDDVFDVLLGSILVRVFVPTPSPRPRTTAGIVEVLLRLLRTTLLSAPTSPTESIPAAGAVRSAT